MGRQGVNLDAATPRTIVANKRKIARGSRRTELVFLLLMARLLADAWAAVKLISRNPSATLGLARTDLLALY